MTLIRDTSKLVGESLQGAASDSSAALGARLESAQAAAAQMQANTAQTVREAADKGQVSHYVAVFSDISAIKNSQTELARLVHLA